MAYFRFPSSAVTSSSLVTYNRNGVATVASIDTVTPGNSTPLPVVQLDSAGNIVTPGALSFTRNAAPQLVTEDTVTPANNRPLPAKITSATGDVTVTNNRLDTAITAVGAGASSIRLSDGTTPVSVSTANELLVRPNGNVASGAADSGNPIKVGGVYRLAVPTFADGNRADLQLDVNGKLLTRDTGAALPPLGQAAMAASLPVVIASNQTPIQEVGNVAAGAADSGNPVKGGAVYNLAAPTYANGNRTDLQATVNGALIVNNPSATAQLTAQTYIDDTPFVSGSLGRISLGVRNDAGGSPVTANGDLQPMQFNSAGELRVTTSAGTAYTEDVAHVASSTGPMVLGYRNDAGTSPVGADGRMHPLQFDNTGNLRVTTGSAVDISKPEDSASANADRVLPAGVVRSDTPGVTTSTDGDYTWMKSTAIGELYVKHIDNISVLGNSASAAADSGNPVKAASVYHSAAQTFTDGNRADLQSNVNGHLLVTDTLLSAKFGTLGQKTMAGSAPVTLASDQSALAITAAALPLPTGAATEVTLAALNGKFSALGQNTMANSAPVVIASNQSALPITAAALPLPTGAATEVTLAALNAKFSALGQNTMANSAPVVIASNQSTLAVGGDVASAAADSGNPVKVGGVYRSAPITLANGQRGDAQLDANGYLKVNVAVGGASSTVDTVGFFTTPLLDASIVNIPGSAGSPVTVIASTTTATKKIQFLDTTGAYIGLYTGAAAAEVLKAIIGPGSDSVIDCVVGAGTRLSLRSLTAATITSGQLAVNLFG